MADWPSTVAVRVSVPALLPVTVKVASPLAFVVRLVALSVLPAADATVTVSPGMAAPAELVSDKVYVPILPRIRLAGPLSVADVPTTPTSIVADFVPAEAVTVIERSVGSPAVPSVAVPSPFVPVVAVVTARPPEVALKVTGTPVRKLLSASRTKAVMVALAELLEGIWGRLVVILIADTAGVVAPLLLLLLLLVLTVANELVPPPPQPAAAVSAASRN